jgi:spermidine synthase
VVAVVGTLVGLEIPLFLRILRRRLAFKELVARVLSLDYLGALVASILFPLLFVPRLGLVRTSLVLGSANALVGLWSTWLLADEIRRPAPLRVRCLAVLGLLLAGLVAAERITSMSEEALFTDPIVHARQSAYQRIVLTAGRGSFQLFLDGNLQFSSADEYRYHEALVHPAMAAAARRREVLVLGGGDGLAVRELLRHPDVAEVTLVDLDPAMTSLAVEVPLVRELNRGSLLDPRVRVVNEDALAWLAELPPGRRFDVAVVDFPDPNNFSLGKLYTTTFYERVDRHLAAGGFAVVQTTSPLLARRSFWTVVATVEAVGLTATPYHAHVPSFGEWGFVMMSRRPWQPPRMLPPGLRFLTVEGLNALLQFPPDMARVDVQPNRLSNQVLVHTFEEEWGKVHP